MKTLCIAVVVLSLSSVCQSFSVACERLLRQVERGPDLSGRWYIIAISSENCLVTTLMNALLSLSAQVDIVSKDAPNLYDANYKVKIYGYCATESDPFFYQNNILFDVTESNGVPTGDPDVLLQSGCPDCITIKSHDTIGTFLLLSRRTNVTAAELQEFETQTKCLGWSKPQVLNSDHDHENCQSVDDDDSDVDTSDLAPKIYQRLKTTYKEPLKCLMDTVLYYPRAAYDLVQNFW